MNWSLSIDKALPRPLRIILRGVGQVFFCCNAVTGFIFLLALYIGGLTAEWFTKQFEGDGWEQMNGGSVR